VGNAKDGRGGCGPGATTRRDCTSARACTCTSRRWRRMRGRCCASTPCVLTCRLTRGRWAAPAGDADGRTAEKEQVEGAGADSATAVVTSAGPEAPKLDLAGWSFPPNSLSSRVRSARLGPAPPSLLLFPRGLPAWRHSLTAGSHALPIPCCSRAGDFRVCA